MKNFFQINQFYQLCEELFKGWLDKHAKIQSDDLLNSICDVGHPPYPYWIAENNDTPLFLLSVSPMIEDGVNLGQDTFHDYLSFSNSFKFKINNSIDSVNRSIPLSEYLDFAKNNEFNSLMSLYAIPFVTKKFDLDEYFNQLRNSFTLFGYYLSLESFLLNKPVLIFHPVNERIELGEEEWKQDRQLMFQMELSNFDFDTTQYSILELDSQGRPNKVMLSDSLNYVVIYLSAN